MNAFQTPPVRRLSESVRRMKCLQACLGKATLIFRYTGQALGTYENELEDYEEQLNNCLSGDISLKLMEKSADCKDPVEITLYEGKNATVTYKGIIMNFCDPTCKMGHFPLVCVKGARKADSVHRALEKVLNCSITAVKVSLNDLRWLSVLSINVLIELDKDIDLEFTYGIPRIHDGKIVFSFSGSDLRLIWSKLHDLQDRTITSGEVNTFHKDIEEHFSLTSQLNLSYCELQQVNVGEVSLKAFDEVFSMNCTSSEMFYILMTYIQSNCLRAC